VAEPEIPPDVTPPTLAQPWGLTGPHIDGHPRHMTDPPADAPKADRPPSHPAYVVAPGSIYAATGQLLANTQEQISGYDALKAHVESTKGWIFWAGGPQVPDAIIPGPWEVADPPRFRDEHPADTAKVVAIQDNLLMQVADVITLAGAFVEVLNNAAQFYTWADKNSVPPQLDVNNA
jgi:hypothetical protein